MVRGLCLIIAGLICGVASAADVFGPFSATPAPRVVRIGSIQVTVIHDGQYVMPNDGKLFGVGVDPAVVGELLRSSGAPTDRITVSVNVLLVKSGKRVLLLDTGLGPKVPGALMAGLKEIRVSPKQVTDVLITHAHGDHIGGLVDSTGHLAFPNATVRMTSAEWSWLQTHGPAEISKVIATHVKPFEPGARLAPGLTAVALEGHTPGHVGYEIVSGTSRLLDIGDLAHSSIISVQQPSWGVGFDNDAKLAMTTREEKLAQLAKDHELVFAPHFPYPGIGHVVARGDGLVWIAGAE